MEWNNEDDVLSPIWDDESNIGVESRDEDSPMIGQGPWVGNRWHDPLDQHLFHQEKAVQGRNFIRITNRIHVR